MEKYLILSLFLFILYGCNSTTDDRFAYKNSKFFADAEALFGEYDYIVTGSRSADGFIIFQIEIPKEKMSLEQVMELKSKIEDRGWKYNYYKEGYYWSYCKMNTYDSIGIYFPIGKNVTLRNGEYLRQDLDPSNIHIWFRKDSSASDYKEFAECK